MNEQIDKARAIWNLTDALIIIVAISLVIRVKRPLFHIRVRATYVPTLELMIENPVNALAIQTA